MKHQLQNLFLVCFLAALVIVAGTSLLAQGPMNCMDTCSWDGSCFQCHQLQTYECLPCCQNCPMPITGGGLSAKYRSVYKVMENAKLPPGHAEAKKRALAKQPATLHSCVVKPPLVKSK